MTNYNWGKFIYIGFLPILLIDSINGWMVRSMSVSVSLPQMYKGIMLIAIIIWLMRYWTTGLYMALSYITVSFIIIFVHSNNYTEMSELGSDIAFAVKLGGVFFYFLFLVSFFRNISNSGWALTWYWRIFSISYLIIAVNILSGTLGFGFTVASFGDDGYGSLGYFKAGNDVASTFLVISGMLMYKIWDLHKTWSYFVFGLLTLILAMLLQTKTIIVGVGIIFCGIPIVYSGIWASYGVLKKSTFYLLMVGGSIFIATVVWISQSELGIVQRFLYHYDRSGFVFALFMGRTYFLDIAIQVLESKASVMDVLFGMGWSNYLTEMGNLYGRDKLVEIDFVDIFMINGVLGLVMVLLIWVYFLINAWRIAKTYPVGNVVLFMDLLLLGIAGTAGHVLYSGMNGPFIALFNALPWLLIHQKLQVHNLRLN